MLRLVTDVQEMSKDKSYYRQPDGSGSVFIVTETGKTRAVIKKPGGIAFSVRNSDLEKLPLYEGEKPQLQRVRPYWKRV